MSLFGVDRTKDMVLTGGSVLTLEMIEHAMTVAARQTWSPAEDRFWAAYIRRMYGPKNDSL